MPEPLPPGYNVKPASCGEGYVILRERYDGAWQALRNEQRQPRRCASYADAARVAWEHYEQEHGTRRS